MRWIGTLSYFEKKRYTMKITTKNRAKIKRVKLSLCLLLCSLSAYASGDYATNLRYSHLYVDIGWYDGVGNYLPKETSIQELSSRCYQLNEYIRKRFSEKGELRTINLIIGHSPIYINNSYRDAYQDGIVTKSKTNYQIEITQKVDRGSETGPSLILLLGLVEFILSEDFTPRKFYAMTDTSLNWIDDYVPQELPKLYYDTLSLKPIKVNFSDEPHWSDARKISEKDVAPNSQVLRYAFYQDTLKAVWNNIILSIKLEGIPPTQIKDRVLISDKNSIYVFNSSGEVIATTPNNKWRTSHSTQSYTDWVNVVLTRFNEPFVSYNYTKNKFYRN